MFHLQDYGESFEISLLVHEDEQGYYPYKIQAVAEGGATFGFEAYMELVFSQPVALDLRTSDGFQAECTTSNIKEFDTDAIRYGIPQSGAITRVFDTRSYISEAAEGCLQTFNLEFTNGVYSPKVTVDEFGGYLFVHTRSDDFIDEEVIIVVTTIIDGEPVVQRTAALRIISECADESTEISSTALPSVSYPANFGYAFSAEGSFASSNPQCPIEVYELDPQSQTTFEIEHDNDGFRVVLRSAFATLPAHYNYAVIAKGGNRVMGSVSGSMEVKGSTQCEKDIQDAVTDDYVIDIPKPGGDHWHKVFGPFDSCKPRVWAIIRDDCVDTDGLGTVDCTLTCTEFGTERDAVDNINQQADGNYNDFLFNDSFEQLEHEQSCTTMWQNPDYPALGAGPLCDLHITNREAAAHEARMAEVHALAESCIIQRQQNLMPMMFDYGLPVEGHDDHFRIDHYTGELYFWDSAEYFEDHHVTFVTTHKDGAVVESNPISIRTRCGPTSTDIESLIIDSIVGDPSGLDFSLSAAFTSSNALCPIESQIISGAGGSRSTSVDVEDFYDFDVTNFKKL